MTSVEPIVVPRLPVLRSLFRAALVLVGAIVLVPLWLPARLERRLRLGEGWFVGCSEALSLVPGRVGVFLRRSFYWLTLDRCAIDVHIGFATTLAHRDAEIEPGVYVGTRCTLGTVTIERHATIGSNVDILSGRRQHNFDSVDQPIQYQGGAFSRVRIGGNAWIGNSSVVMADIGEDCVIGAGSVVVKPIPPCSVAVGNPAVVKRTRAA